MALKDLNIKWGTISEIKPKDIVDEDARSFIKNLRYNFLTPVIDVYVCSDTRNKGLRQILANIGNVNIIASAGNVVENPKFNPSIVIAHGKSDQTCGCGAVDYAANPGDDSTFDGIIENVKGDPIENAIRQLMHVPEEARAGVLYFDHTKARLEEAPGNHRFAKYDILLSMFRQMKYSLDGRYTDEEIKSMATGQYPKIIFMNNYNAQSTASDLFRVDVQGQDISKVVIASLGYSMSHALNGFESFANSKTTIFALDKSRVPHGLEDLTNMSFVKDYVVKRGGDLYLIEIGTSPDQKVIHKVLPNK